MTSQIKKKTKKNLYTQKKTLVCVEGLGIPNHSLVSTYMCLMKKTWYT